MAGLRFGVALGVVAAVGSNPLTGITAVDIVERFGVGLLLGAIAWRMGKWAALVSAAIVVAVFFAPVDQSWGAFAVGCGAAGATILVLAHDLGRRCLLYATGIAVVLGAPAAALLLSARADANQARQQLASVKTAVLNDQTAATKNLAQVDARIDTVRSRANHVLAKPARLIPFVSSQMRATQQLLDGIHEFVGAARGVADAVELSALKLENGRIPFERIAELHDSAARLEVAASAARRDAVRVDETYLVPPLADVVDSVIRQATEARDSAHVLKRFAQNAPGLFGANEPRRYFLAVQNPSEARASGGILGAYAEVAIDDGRMSLARVGRNSDLNALSADRPRETSPEFARFRELQPKRYWQNVTASPDFPTVARVIKAEYEPIGNPIDGVISVDPPALAALLRVIGPVTVKDWPEPLTADNVVRILEHEQYIRFDNVEEFPDRETFMATALATVWSKLSSAPLALGGLTEVGNAVADGHISLYAVRAPEQEFFARAGVAGQFPTRSPDTLAVTSQNANANKTDWFVTRTVHYEPRIVGNKFTATVSVTVKNDAPSSGLPFYILGDNNEPNQVGHNKAFLSIYTPWQLDSADMPPDAVALFHQTDQNLNVYATELDVPPGESRTIVVRLKGDWKGGEYALAYRPQALAKGDLLTGFLPNGEALRRGIRPKGVSSAIRGYR